MKLLGNIYFFNVYKTFNFNINGDIKTLYMGQYQKTDLLNFFLNLNCFDYINNKLKVNKIITIRFSNLFDKNLFFLLAGFNKFINENDTIFNLENDTAMFDVFVENNLIVNFKILDIQNKILFEDQIETGAFKSSLILNYPSFIFQKDYRIKFYNIYTNEEMYSLQSYLITP